MKVFYNRRRSFSFNHLLANFWHRRVGLAGEQVSLVPGARADGRREPFIFLRSFLRFYLVTGSARVSGSEDADDA